MERLIEKAPSGEYTFIDYLDDDGFENRDIPIKVKIIFKEKKALVDFSGSASQVKGCVNAPKAVTCSAVYYVFLSLLNTIGEYPINHGCFKPIEIITKLTIIVSATYPSAVAGGNVETSQRIVDVLLGALSKAFPELIPASSCGTMNNLLGKVNLFVERGDKIIIETPGGGGWRKEE